MTSPSMWRSLADLLGVAPADLANALDDNNLAAAA